MFGLSPCSSDVKCLRDTLINFFVVGATQQSPLTLVRMPVCLIYLSVRWEKGFVKKKKDKLVLGVTMNRGKGMADRGNHHGDYGPLLMSPNRNVYTVVINGNAPCSFTHHSKGHRSSQLRSF